MKQKKCQECGKTKPVGKFALSPMKADGSGRQGDGRISKCNACRYARKKALREQWPDGRKRERSILRQKTARKWERTHPYSMKARRANLQAQRRGAPGKITGDEMQSVWQEWNDCCWICGAPAEATDHLRPINGKAGGANSPENVRPICTACNHKRDHGWYGMEYVEAEAALLRQIAELRRKHSGVALDGVVGQED